MVALRPRLNSASRSLRRGARIANIGVHGKPASLHLEKIWDRNIAITARLVDTSTIPMLFKTAAAKTKALKAIISPA